jgi:hypothetical protein
MDDATAKKTLKGMVLKPLKALVLLLIGQACEFRVERPLP